MITWRRRVRYAPELDDLTPGTILTFPGSRVTALRDDNGWLLYGRRNDGVAERDTAGVVARNLPAFVARKGRKR